MSYIRNFLCREVWFNLYIMPLDLAMVDFTMSFRLTYPPLFILNLSIVVPISFLGIQQENVSNLQNSPEFQNCIILTFKCFGTKYSTAPYSYSFGKCMARCLQDLILSHRESVINSVKKKMHFTLL